MTAVVFILGSGHSGSTLLDRMIGSSPGFCSTGELVERPRIDERADVDDRCTCGAPILHCDFWVAVRDGGDIDGSASEDVAATIGRIGAVAGARFVVDSSKRPWRLLELIRAGLDVRVIHLVRDGRAVAFSGDKFGRSYPTLVWRWAWTQSSARRILRRAAVSEVTVRYEDLARHPETELARISEEVLDGMLTPDAWRRPAAEPQHLLSGNAMRFRSLSAVELDVRFLKGLSPWEWWVGSALAPMTLRAYGYPLRRSNYLAHV